jgi:tetratricopeptide (TPR) repeat protein
MAIANLYVTLGSAYLGQHDSSHSLTAFRTAYALAPGYADALFGLGKWEGEARHYPEAINFLRAALRANPSTNIAHRLLGNCLALQNQWPDARDEYAQYVREQPDDPLGYRLLANALRHLGDVRGAEEAERHAANL